MPRVIVLGEDVIAHGGPYAVTRASCHPSPGVHVARTMWSVKTPGSFTSAPAAIRNATRRASAESGSESRWKSSRAAGGGDTAMALAQRGARRQLHRERSCGYS